MFLSLLLLSATTLPSSSEEVSSIPQEIVVESQHESSKEFLSFSNPISNDKHAQFFAQASRYVDENANQCALFVNRLFLARFNQPMYGNAWDLQTKKENKEFLNLEWRIPKTQIYSENNFNFPWGHFKERVDHFESLYTYLDSQSHPIGVLGLLYKYSAFKDTLLQNKSFLPQTHVAFVAGKSHFTITNISENPQTILEILEKEHGKIKSYEYDFVNKKIPLTRELQPQESYTYSDYLIQEYFKKPISGSLLELFLRKHRNNRIEELLRPISFSRVSDDLLEAEVLKLREEGSQ